MSEAFEHNQAAHCETGTLVNLLRHQGLNISEPLVFGLSCGLTYAYLPVVKINGLPLFAYRMPPRMIIKQLAWRIKGLKFHFQTFNDEQQGMAALDERLSRNEVVGVQTSVFFLPYFPEHMRFHFNAHNMLVYGKEGNEYQISDPVFSHLVSTDGENLRKARFARGALAPKGMMYYVESMPAEIDYEKVAPKSIRFTAKINGRWNPVPFAGVYGMRMVAKRIEKLKNEDPRYARLFMGHIVRMQEEIGTGGAGFRFMYAAFLQQISEMFGSDVLREASEEMVRAGDELREFALLAARINKQRGDQDFFDAAEQLRKVAQMEMDIYNELASFKL